MKRVECTLKNLLSLEELFIDYQADVGDLERPELKLSVGVDDSLLVHEASDAVFAQSHHQLGVLANLCTLPGPAGSAHSRQTVPEVRASGQPVALSALCGHERAIMAHDEGSTKKVKNVWDI